jgi:hypothetical protein
MCRFYSSYPKYRLVGGGTIFEVVGKRNIPSNLIRNLSIPLKPNSQSINASLGVVIFQSAGGKDICFNLPDCQLHILLVCLQTLASTATETEFQLWVLGAASVPIL